MWPCLNLIALILSGEFMELNRTTICSTSTQIQDNEFEIKFDLFKSLD